MAEELLSIEDMLSKQLSEAQTTPTPTPGTGSAYEVPEDLYTSKESRLARSEELKRKRLYRKGEIELDSSGNPIHDSDAMIRAKEVANAGIKGVDWLLEASENIADFGQGDLIDHYDGFKAENQGKRYSMGNKDFIAARGTTTEELKNVYQTAKHDPGADKGIYTLKKFDGYNDDGTAKYIYKYGLADVSADTRYRDQYVQDGFEIVEEKRFAGAEDWEKAWNASQGVLDARTLDNSFDMVEGPDGTMMSRDEASGINFGSGKTELLDKDLLGTDVGKTEEDYAKNKLFSEQLSSERDSEGYMDNSVLGRTLNTAAGAASMLARTVVVDTADWVSESLFDFDLGTAEEKKALTDKMFSYDDRFAKENMAEISGHIDKMMTDGEVTWDGVKGVLSNALANVESTGESIGYLVGLTMGVGKFTKFGKALDAVESAGKAGTMTAAQVAKNTAKITKDATLAQKASYQIAKNAGMINVSAGGVNDDIDDFKANNDGEAPTPGHLMFMYGNRLISNLSERFVDLTVLKQAGVLKSAKDGIANAGKKELAGIMGKVVDTSKILAISMGEEFAQEYYQTMAETVNKQWGTKKYGEDLGEILTDRENVLEGLTAGSAGAGGAAHFTAAGGVAKVARGELDNRSENKEDKKAKDTGLVSEASAVDGVASESVQESENKIDMAISNRIPKAVANEDGTYNNEDSIKEYGDLYNKLVVPIRNVIETGVANNDFEDVPVGTAKVAVNRMKEAISRLDQDNMTDAEKKSAENALAEVVSFETEINDILTNKISKYSLDEIEAMTHDQIVHEFGAEADTGTEVAGDDFDAQTDDEQKVIDKKIEDGESLGEYDTLIEQAEAAERKSAIDKKRGNTRSAKGNSNKAKRKRRVKQTLDNIFEEDFYSKNKGVVNAAARLIDENLKRVDIEKSKDKVLEHTKKWMVENGYFDDKTKTEADTREDKRTPNKIVNDAYSKGAYSTVEDTKAETIAGAKAYIAEFEKALKKLDESEYGINESLSKTKDRMKKTLEKRLKDSQEHLAEAERGDFDNNYKTTVSSKTVDDITDADVEKFFGHKETRWGRAEYYKDLNDKKIVSILDHNRVLDKITKDTKKFSEGIKKTVAKKKSKRKAIQEAVIGVAGEIRTRYTELETNGIPEEGALLDIGTFKEGTKNTAIANPNPTNEEIIEQLRLEFGDKSKTRDGHKFIIHYNNILDHMEGEGNPDYKPAGVFELLQTVQKEIDTLQQIEFDDTGSIKLAPELEQEVARREQVKKDKKNAEAKKAYGDDVEILSEKEVKDIKEQIAEYEVKLIRVTNAVKRDNTVDNNTQLNMLQEDLVAEVAKTDNITASLYREYLRLKNLTRGIKKNTKAIDTRLKQVNKEIRQLREQRDEIITDAEEAHKDIQLQGELKDESWTDRARMIAQGIAAKANNLVHGFKKKLIELHSLNLQILKLSKEKTRLRIQKGQNKNVLKKTRTAKDEKVNDIENRTDLDIDKADLKEKLKRKSKIKYKGILIDKLKELTAKISTPSRSIEALVDQKEQMKNWKNVAFTDVPLVISEHTTTARESSSAISLMDIGNIENDKLKKYIADADDFFEKSGIIDYIKQFPQYVPERVPIETMLLDAEGNLNKNIATSIVLAANLVLRNRSSFLHSKTDEDIDRMLGLRPGGSTTKQKELFRHRTRRSNLANEIGNEIMNMLDYKVKPDGDIEAFERFKASAGLAGIKYLLDKEYLVEDSMDTKTYNEFMKKEYDPDSSSENVGDSTVNFLTRPKDGKGGYKRFDKKFIEGLKNDFKSMESDTIIPRPMTSVKFIEPKEVKIEDRKIKDNPYMNVTKEVGDALNNLESQEYEMLMGPTKMLFDIGREKALKLIGYIPDEEVDANDELTYDAKEAQKASNKEKERAYDELVTLHESIEDGTYDNAMWFKWFTPKNNRLNIDSVLIDPQNEKEIHRWFITPKKSRRLYNKKQIKRNHKSTIGFKLAIAQAFGFDIDKKTLNESRDFANDILKMPISNEYDNVPNENGAKYESITQMINNGEFDHLGHALTALDAIIKFNDDSPDIDTTITAEYDGITNGVILKTLQLMFGENSAAIVAKGGFVAKDVPNNMGKYQSGIDYNEYDSMLDEISDSTSKMKNADIEENGAVIDVYYTQALEAELDKEAIDARIEESDKRRKFYNIPGKTDFYGLGEDVMAFVPDITKGLTKPLRELFKYPTMITGYGGAIATVVNSVAYGAANEALSKIVFDYSNKDSKTYDVSMSVLNKLSKKHKIPPQELIHRLRTESASSIGSMSGKKFYSIEDNLATLFKAALGEAVGNAIEKTFGETIQITNKVNESSRYMFRVFEQALNQEIDKVAKEEGEGSTTISQNKLVEITMKLKEFMPIFDGPGSSERLKDGIAIFKSGLSQDGDLKYSSGKNSKGKTEDTKVLIRWVDDDGNQKAMNARTFVKKIMEAYSSAGVLPTHTEDAIDMSKLINEAMSYTGITPVHDAVIIDGEDPGKPLKSMNKNIVDTSKSYSLMNSIANAMRSIYNATNAYKDEYEFNLDDMRTKEDQETLKEDAKEAGEEYEPADFETEMYKMEDLAEKVWIKRERYFAHDIKVDQMPGPDSQYESKAKYDKQKFIDELVLRINRRKDNANLGTDKQVAAYAKKLLQIPVGTRGETNKINSNLDIIELITNVINGEC